MHTFSVRKPEPGARWSATRSAASTHQTVYLLEAGAVRLAMAGLRRAIPAPRRFVEAVRSAIRVVPPGHPRSGRVRPVSYLLEAAYLADCLQARGVAHLHNHIGENSAVVAMLAACFADVPYSLTIHGPNEFDRPTLLALDEKIGMRGLRGRDQRIHPQPALPVVRTRALGEDPGRPLRAGRIFLSRDRAPIAAIGRGW